MLCLGLHRSRLIEDVKLTSLPALLKIPLAILIRAFAFHFMHRERQSLRIAVFPVYASLVFLAFHY